MLVLQRALCVTAGLLLGAGQLSGCAEVRKTLGYEKTVPDEFAIIAQGPLEVPETFDLVALAAVTARRQLERTPEPQVSQILTGYSQPEWSSDDNNISTPALQAFLQMTRADSDSSDIRAIVDHESLTKLFERRALRDRMMFWRVSLPEGRLDMGRELRRLQESER